MKKISSSESLCDVAVLTQNSQSVFAEFLRLTRIDLALNLKNIEAYLDLFNGIGNCADLLRDIINEGLFPQLNLAQLRNFIQIILTNKVLNVLPENDPACHALVCENKFRVQELSRKKLISALDRNDLSVIPKFLHDKFSLTERKEDLQQLLDSKHSSQTYQKY